MTRYLEVHERLRQMRRLYYAAALAWQVDDADLAIPVRSAAAQLYESLAADLMTAYNVAGGDGAGREAATADLATIVAAVREQARLHTIELACQRVPGASAVWTLARDRLTELRAQMGAASAAEAGARRRILEDLAAT